MFVSLLPLVNDVMWCRQYLFSAIKSEWLQMLGAMIYSWRLEWTKMCLSAFLKNAHCHIDADCLANELHTGLSCDTCINLITSSFAFLIASHSSLKPTLFCTKNRCYFLTVDVPSARLIVCQPGDENSLRAGWLSTKRSRLKKCKCPAR